MSSKTLPPALVPKLRFPEFQSAGNWTTKKLGTLATISTEKVGTNSCVPMSITSGVGLVSQEDKFGRVIAGDSYKNYLLLKPNDFAYNKSATKEYPEGFLTLYSGTKLAAVPNSIFTCFRLNGDSPDVRFLNYQFSDNLHGRWLRQFIQVGARAHGSLSINDNDLMALPVPVPAGTTSVDEQQKIADCLSSVDELIAAQARKVETLKTHKKGLMQQLFPREGETQPRRRLPEFRKAGEWGVKPLGELVELQSGFAFSSRNFGGKGRKLVTPKNFTKHGHGNFDETVSKYTTEQVPERFICRPGDLLVLLTDLTPTCELLGKPLLLEDKDGTVLLNQRVVRIEPSAPELETVFLKYALLSEPYSNRIIKTATGSTVKHSSNRVLQEMPLSYPGPPEQQRIGSCLSSLDVLIAAETQELEALKTHKNGLMQRLFPSAKEVEA